MDQAPSAKTSQRMDWIWFTTPVMAFVLVAVTVGVVASRHTGS